MKHATSLPPKQAESLTPDEVIARMFAPLDQLALGLALGVVGSAMLFLATIILLLKGGEPLGPNLSLLSEYIPGYSPSWPGSLIGGAGGFLAGFMVGWTIAFLTNLAVAAYIYASAFWVRLNRFLDDI